MNIKNSDGSVRRWQIKSKDAPKTPKMSEEVQGVINEILDKIFSASHVQRLEEFTKSKLPIIGRMDRDFNIKAVQARTPDDTHGETGVGWVENDFNFRYRSDLNVFYHWGDRPTTDQKNELYHWVRRNFGDDIPPAKFININASDLGYKVAHGVRESVELLNESPRSDTLKKNKKPLTDAERKQVMNAGAVWHHGPNGEKTPAVWKAVVNGKTWYCCNTHRAIQIKPTLKGAIKAFEFIKTTA